MPYSDSAVITPRSNTGVRHARIQHSYGRYAAGSSIVIGPVSDSVVTLHVPHPAKSAAIIIIGSNYTIKMLKTYGK